MAQFVNCLSCKQDDLSSNLQHPHKNQEQQCEPNIPVLGRQRQKIPGALCPAWPNLYIPSSVSTYILSKQMGIEQYSLQCIGIVQHNAFCYDFYVYAVFVYVCEGTNFLSTHACMYMYAEARSQLCLPPHSPT